MVPEAIIPTRDLATEMKESYLLYSVSVVVSRALPDVRDGLKPSQRRLIVAMNDLRLAPNSEFRKCAKICGDTSGNYHPHGESVVYPTLVRLAQPFNVRYCLIDGQGNFGSVNGDAPAAMRYTEARLSRAATALLEHLDDDTVDFTPNFDNRRTEPAILPGLFPNLLCNGAQGIAVGLTTNMLPHNLREIAKGISYLIDHPNASTKQLMKYVPAPDFPTGGLVDAESALQYYETGKGRFTIRAKVEIELGRSIVVTEIPYQVERSRIVEQVRKGIKGGRLSDITSIQDESSLKVGTRIVIDLKRGKNAKNVLELLYRYTSLEVNSSANNVALIGKQPRLLSLRGLMQYYINHRFEVIQRRAGYLLGKVRDRLHLVEGLLRVVQQIDQAIKLIRDADDDLQAAIALKEKFDLSDLQTKAILDLQLRRLTKINEERLLRERATLLQQANEHRALLADPKVVLQTIKLDLKELVNAIGDDRRTAIVEFYSSPSS